MKKVLSAVCWVLFVAVAANAQMEEGAALLLRAGSAEKFIDAPEVKADVSIHVTGPIVRTTVRQTFHNNTGACVEGVYVYPLPEMSAVDTLKMTVGPRIIEGEIREREEAKKEYEKARSEGRKAALIEQQRPNVFTTSVASLMPDEDATIEIAYQETARFDSGEYRMRFPMVVVPRYTPAGATAAPHSAMNADPLPTVTLSVDLDPGYSLRDVHSLNHRIRTETLGNRQYRVAVDEPIHDYRDFELSWKPDLGSNPEATVLTEKLGDATYALVLVTPPQQASARMPRETVFIIDSSGSMQGASMDQAKDALLLALDDLRPSDTFNIIDFDDVARPLFPQSMSADPSRIAEAKQFIDTIKADGGTEMLNALRIALPGNQTMSSNVRQVIFMTDGQVSNEQELFTYIHDHLGETRLFTVGIGAAPNSHFMRNAARFGRGTYTYGGDRSQVKERMGELFTKLDAPVMTSIALQSSDKTAESWPQRVPDVYLGEPVVVAVRLHDPNATITLTGKQQSSPWSKQLTLPAAAPEGGIARLWGREKIESLMDGLSEGRQAAQVRTEVVSVALQHHLVSQYTSLVAVDKTPQGLTGMSCKPATQAVDNAVPGQESLPQTATAGRLLLLIALSLIGIAVVLVRIS